MEDEEPLERVAVIYMLVSMLPAWHISIGDFTSHTADPINDTVYQFFANGVMAARICKIDGSVCVYRDSRCACALTIIRSILLATNQELRMEELAIGASANFVDWLLIHQSLFPCHAQCSLVCINAPRGLDRRRWSEGHICHCQFR
jgi:hypothetical protein